MSDELIDRLADNLKPVGSDALQRRLLAWLAVGVVVAAVLMVASIGLRPDFPEAFGDPVFWVKFAYPLMLGLAGLYAVERLSRPGATARRVHSLSRRPPRPAVS
jgi:hypothetical protein